MKIINTEQMKTLMNDFPEGGIVFVKYTPHAINSELMVTDGSFGATNVIPWDGEVFDWDWNIEEYEPDDLFMIFDNNDILQMVQTLTKGCKINLVEDWE